MRRSPPMRTYNLTHANDGASYPLGGMACQPLSPTRKMNMKSASSRSAKPRAAKPISTTVKSRSKTDWARLNDASDAAKPTDEHPDSAVRRIVRGVVRRGLQPAATKTAISLRVDQDVLEWFKAQGDGYQTRINSVLRAFRDASV